MIPRKLYAHLTDLESEYIFHPDKKNFDAVTQYQDAIGWPFKANQEQINDWNNMNHEPIKEQALIRIT